FRPLDGVARLLRSSVGRDKLQEIARIDGIAQTRGDLRRDIEPQLHPFRRGPCRAAVRKSIWPRRRPERLAEHIEAAEITAGFIRNLVQQPPGRDQVFVRTTDLAEWRCPRLVEVDQR